MQRRRARRELGMMQASLDPTGKEGVVDTGGGANDRKKPRREDAGCRFLMTVFYTVLNTARASRDASLALWGVET